VCVCVWWWWRWSKNRGVNRWKKKISQVPEAMHSRWIPEAMSGGIILLRDAVSIGTELCCVNVEYYAEQKASAAASSRWECQCHLLLLGGLRLCCSMFIYSYDHPTAIATDSEQLPVRKLAHTQHNCRYCLEEMCKQRARRAMC
jgi:hypothetical protein